MRPEGEHMRRLLAAATFAAASLLTIGPVAAEPPGREGAFNFYFGGFFPKGGGDFWDANEAAFTLDHSDFNGPAGGIGYTASINNYIEFNFDGGWYGRSNTSADRNFTDQNGFAILHDTRLSIFPLTVSFRVLPAGRFGRRGTDGTHYVRRPVPYLGVGIGGEYWQYEEEGDFVASDLSVVYDRLTATGFTFEKHAMVGIEFPVAPAWNITFEVRQSWAEATPGGAFAVVNPGRLDLGGTSVMLGGSFRF
jgi:outer membrane protein W